MTITLTHNNKILRNKVRNKKTENTKITLLKGARRRVFIDVARKVRVLETVGRQIRNTKIGGISMVWRTGALDVMLAIDVGRVHPKLERRLQIQNLMLTTCLPFIHVILFVLNTAIVDVLNYIILIIKSWFFLQFVKNNMKYAQKVKKFDLKTKAKNKTCKMNISHIDSYTSSKHVLLTNWA